MIFHFIGREKATDLSSDILEKIESDGLDVMMYHAQGNDKAGIHGGVQAILKGQIKKAIFNGCVDYSVNLCSHCSFAEIVSCDRFLKLLRHFLYCLHPSRGSVNWSYWIVSDEAINNSLET